MFAVTAASGKTGRRVAELLLGEKHQVRAIVRSPEKAGRLREMGADVQCGSLSDAAFLRSAFQDCSGVYLVTPLNWGSPEPAGEEIACGKAAAEALAGSQAHVIYLSVLRAREKTGVPHFESKDTIETALEAACTNLTVLRPGFFMQNFLQQAGAIVGARAFSFPMPGDQPLAMVSTADIADTVRQAFVRGPKGKEAFDVIGLRCYTMAECARLIGNACGRNVGFTESSEKDFQKMMRGAGASEASVADLLTMFKFFSTTRFTGDFDNVRKAFKFLSTTFERFAEQELLPVLAAAGKR